MNQNGFCSICLKNENSLTPWRLWLMVRAAGICHSLSAGSGNTDQDRAGGSNQWAVPCGAQKPTFLGWGLGRKERIIGLVQSNKWPQRSQNIWGPAPKTYPASQQNVASFGPFDECILHGMFQSNCRPNLSSKRFLPYKPVFIVTKLLYNGSQ
jgi:hypothetical protein